jgi:rod shape determining protein RodA
MFGIFKGRLVLVRICLVASVLMLVGIGVATIYAVGHPLGVNSDSDMGKFAGYFKKQLIFMLLGSIGFILVNLINYRVLGDISLWLYSVTLVLLASLLVSKYIYRIPFIPEINGTFRWIQISVGSYQLPSIQPSEFCKLTYILALAWYLRYRSNYRKLKSLVGPFLLTVLPVVLILAEPDLGTVMLLMPVMFVMLFVAGAKTKHLVMIILVTLMMSPFFWFKMKPYQRQRISSVFLQSETIRKKTETHQWLSTILAGEERFRANQWINEHGYQMTRSKLAIASGGLTGNGFRQGFFIRTNRLPERHNDLIFASIAHQWGLMGCLGVLGLYAIMVICALEIAANNTDPFGRLVVVGIVTMFIIEVFINVSMTLGVMPITGLTLPFVSYGGSSLLVSLIAIGLLNNIGRCRAFTLAKKE